MTFRNFSTHSSIMTIKSHLWFLTFYNIPALTLNLVVLMWIISSLVPFPRYVHLVFQLFLLHTTYSLTIVASSRFQMSTLGTEAGDPWGWLGILGWLILSASLGSGSPWKHTHVCPCVHFQKVLAEQEDPSWIWTAPTPWLGVLVLIKRKRAGCQHFSLPIFPLWINCDQMPPVPVALIGNACLLWAERNLCFLKSLLSGIWSQQ